MTRLDDIQVHLCVCVCDEQKCTPFFPYYKVIEYANSQFVNAANTSPYFEGFICFDNFNKQGDVCNLSALTMPLFLINGLKV